MDWFKDLTAKPLAALRVLVKAWPTWASAITAVLAAVATEVVPELPGPWAVQVAAWIAVALGAIAAVSKAVSKVTPVIYPSEEGLLPLPEVAMEFDKNRLYGDPTGNPRATPPPPAGARRTPRRG